MKGNIRRKILTILGCGFLFVLVGLLVFNLMRKGIYDGKMGMNVAIVNDRGVSLILLRPEEEMISWVDLPSDIMVKIYNSSASYPLSSLWRYGEGEKNPFGIVEKSLGQSMGVVIPRVIHLEKGGQIEDVLGSLLSFNLKTDLSLKDRLELRRFLGDSVKSKKYLELSMPETVFDKTVDPDGKEFFLINNTMSLWTENKFVLEPLLNEGVDVSINNVSGVDGQGFVLSRQLESAGMHVVEVKADTNDNISGTGCLFSSSKEFPMTEKFLIDQIGCKKVKHNTDDDGGRLKIWLR